MIGDHAGMSITNLSRVLLTTALPSSTTIAATISQNESTTCATCMSPQMTSVMAICTVLVVIVGLAGNAFVVGVIVTDRKLLNSSVNLFLLNLALADLGNIMFAAPEAMLVLIGKGWVLPDILCPVIRFLEEYYLYASDLLQISIGIERYMAICSPLRMQRFTRRTTVYVLGVVWAVAAAFALPYLLFMHIKGFPGHPYMYCSWDNSFPEAFRLVFRHSEFAILFAIPLVLLTVLYTVMGRVLWGGKSATIANEVQQAAVLRLRRSVVKMLMISMLVYFICYTPIQGLFVSEFFFHKRFEFGTPLRYFLNLLPMVSSSANPIVYIMCCRHFHSRFIALVGCAISSLCPCPCGWSGGDRYAAVVSGAEKAVASRSLSRSPYVSFRKSMHRSHTHSVTLL